MTRFAAPIAYLVLSACLLAVVHTLAFRQALDQLGRTGQAQLTLASDRLLGQLAPFRQLPNLLARHPALTGLFDGTTTVDAANDFLANTALTIGADAIHVLDLDGTVIAASDFESPQTALGRSYGRTPYVSRALSGSLGVQHGIDPNGGERDFFIARGVIDGTAPPVGVIVVRVDVAALEFDWKVDPSVLVILDRAGVIFVANRTELPLMRDAAAGSGTSLSRHYGTLTPKPFYDYSVGSRLFGGLWQFGQNPVMPHTALVLSQDMPRIDMTARIFLDTTQAAASARVTTYLAAAVLATVAAGLWALGQRRRRLADRLATEARANARLEARVEDRTRQLRDAQEQLVQAGKMTALGQMSAGVSHELNQPLAAIRNYAENGVKLIDRDRADEAQANLRLIAEQADRITRIIRNLRAFARKEPETLGPVDASGVIADAMRMAEVRARDENVELVREGTQGPVMVLGGQVRLQQVLVNLIGNALDAVAEASVKRVTVTLEDGAPVRILVRDTGPGLDDPDRVFEPFYTTKEVGASKGLGLGLSISYGIIGSFGGKLSCRNTGKGAEFLITLKKAAS